MKTSELIDMFTAKGSGEMGKLSPKQHNWLISAAQQEGLYVHTGHGDGVINMPDKKRFVVKSSHRLASGGSYVGTKATGNFSIRLYYRIKFTDTGFVEFRDSLDVRRIQQEGIHQFDII